MNVNGIGTAGYPAWQGTRKAESNEKDNFGANVKATGNVVHIAPDALFSIYDAKTGESANVYRADDYSEENPFYIVKGMDKNGNEYEQMVDVSKVNPNSCSYMCQRRFKIVRKRQPNFVVFQRNQVTSSGVSLLKKRIHGLLLLAHNFLAFFQPV